MTKLSTTEVAERLSTPVSTVKLWADRLRIGERNSQGQRRFSDGDLTLLEVVRSLRDSDCGFETITRRLSSTPVNDQQPPVNGHQRELPPEAPALDADALAERITAAVISASRADNELAERYARAAHRIGELEAENRMIREQADESRRLLTDGQGETDALKAKLAVETQDRIRAEAERDTLKAQAARPWWRKLLGQ